jgi:hypothetical protein
MCPEQMEKGYCEKGHDKCHFAHSAIELDLVKTNSTNINNRFLLKRKLIR